MKKVCFVTGSRADYGILKILMKKVPQHGLALQIIATGMHLAHEFGLTYKEIEEDGFKIDTCIEVNLSSDTSIAVCKAMGLGMISFAEAYHYMKPDLIIVLGDRYEIFAAVSAAYISGIPIAHLHGGEITEGAFDEGLRHCITKMSHLHFTSTEEYANRVIQLGEMPDKVHHVGALSVEQIKEMAFVSKESLEEFLKFELKHPLALVTFHPVTLDNENILMELNSLFEALDAYKELHVVFTKANADSKGRMINAHIDAYVKAHQERTISVTSLGSLRYLSLMKYSDVVIGNSSSGIIEAPTLKIPVVNIGSRQAGRVQASSTVNVLPIKEDIVRGIQWALEEKAHCGSLSNPYEKDDTSETIIQTIKAFLQGPLVLKKTFYDMNKKEGENV